MLDARYLAGLSDNEISPFLTYKDTFGSQRWLAGARLSGRWTWQNFTFTPSIEYVHFSERSESYVSSSGVQIDSQKVSIDRLVFGPEIRHRTDLADRSVLGIHVGVKGLWDMRKLGLRNVEETVETPTPSAFHVRFDVGASLQTASGMSLEVNLGYEGLGSDSYTSRSLTGRLRVPLQ